jgi:hypothetical protein
MKENSYKNEHGQNLIIFAVLTVVLVALAGLVIDGGFSLVKRREAQNAADAGALAGAEALCNGNVDQAIPQAWEYAVTLNHAADAEITVATKDITVTTTIPHQTFLMKIFGTDVVTTTATASAGCYVPCNIKGVLPVAWFCQTPPTEDGGDCGITYPPLDGDPQKWVIMDSIKTIDDICQDPISHLPVDGVDCDLDNDGVNELVGGVCQDPVTHLPADALDCDINNDGINDVFAGGDDQTGGNRAWLDLNGSGSDSGNGSNELRQWVLNGYNGELTNHTWLAGQSGVANDVFQAADEILGTIVLLPVFDEYPCSGLPDVNCPELYHTDPPDKWQDHTIVSNGSSTTYYHIVTFSAFKITCVDAPGVKNSQTPCPGKAAVLAANPDIPNNIKTIEGYFVKADAGSGKCEGTDAGVHTMYLNH